MVLLLCGEWYRSSMEDGAVWSRRDRERSCCCGQGVGWMAMVDVLGSVEDGGKIQMSVPWRWYESGDKMAAVEGVCRCPAGVVYDSRSAK